jgi:superfamily II DNA or RNA helicase
MFGTYLDPAFLAGCSFYEPTLVARRLSRVLRKAVVRTPTTDKGRVDYDRVPKGASIWVTVTDESSPLHGRPILITKRPDGKFALTGGAGWEHYKEDVKGGRNEDLKQQRARKHMVLEGVGKKAVSEADKERAAELALKRKEIHAAQTERRKKRDEAARGLLAAVGHDPDKLKSDRDFEKLRTKTEAEARSAGMSAGDSRRLVGLAINEAKKIRHKLALQQAELEAAASLHAKRNGMDRLDAAHASALAAMPAPDAILDRELISGDRLRAMIDEGADEPELEQYVKDQAASVLDQLYADSRAASEEASPEASVAAPEAPGATEGSSPEERAADQNGAQNGFDASERQEAPRESGDEKQNDPSHDALQGQQEGSGRTKEGDPVSEAAEIPGASGEVGPDSADSEAESEEDDEEADEDEQAEGDEAAPEEDEPEADDPERQARVERIGKLAQTFADYHAAHQEVRSKTEESAGLRSALLMGASEVENLRTKVGALSDTDLDLLLDRYQNPHQQHAPDAFYGALRDHWNDAVDYAAGVGQYANAGAAAALIGIVGKHVGAGVDVARLITSGSIETAVTALALKLRDDLDDRGFDKLIGDLTTHNAKNQQATEDRALAQHKKLEQERKEIIRQRFSGELSSDPELPILEHMKSGDLSPASIARYATSTRLEADNLLRQRENLGTALGSMQASAGLLEALTRARKAKKAKDQVVSLSFGDNLDAAHEQLIALGLAGRARMRHDIQRGWLVDIPSKSLKRHMGQVQTHASFAADMEAIKTDGRSTEGYSVPGWKTEVGGRPYQWRTEQRNDIEWLRKTGGGVITRVTGAGKTNTALGFYAHQLAAKPDYTAAIVVPKGKASEWHSEAQRFSSLPTVPIPDDAKRADVQALLKQHGRGALYVMSHDQAARHADLLDDHDLDGITIDEPHMLTGKGKSKKMSAGAQRIMRLGSDKIRGGEGFHRIALTATPAKSDPVNAYDLVNWVAPGKIGSRERFRRAYAGGFGAGTNAQEEAVHEQVIKHLGPYMSGERLTPPSYQTKRHESVVGRSRAQVERQKEIERGSRAFVEKRVADRLARAADDPMIKVKYGAMWRAKVAQEETAKAHDEIARQHRDNLGGGEDNPKIEQALAAIKEHGADANTKHVFFVDSAAQRQALMGALNAAGYKANQVANMASTTTTIGGEELAARR